MERLYGINPFDCICQLRPRTKAILEIAEKKSNDSCKRLLWTYQQKIEETQCVAEKEGNSSTIVVWFHVS